MDDKFLLLFNARNDIDRQKFVDDLKESILEMKEMDLQRIKQQSLIIKSSNSLLDLNQSQCK
ncbi:IQ motif and SEC7 domain-containing protein 1-like protein [Leptotrombidium deliense]|uniref:IQ motif and SEC7 domain-containing protein 1-like protein n=1 Tax=Leptotrombidium deliense TaxID=299467 RepID=A0A443SWI6_9ACAR|nr:IQ motif and SEC7 domain-containing protein 1-like protein [Leptotrombidium deliense]